MSWINIARVGKFKDMAGRLVDFTRSTLEQIARDYDPKRLQAPLVFGHPQTNDPAFGWVEGLRVVGDTLQARLKDVPEEVKALIAKGHYRHVSMSLNPDWTLRHVGLLGAVPPAIDGLGEVSFGADEDATTIEFSTEPAPADSREADMATLEELQRQLMDKDKEIATLTAERNEAVTARDKATSDFAAFRGEQEAKAREARFEKLVADEKALPAERDQILGFAATLGQAGTTVNFAAEGKVEQISQEESYWRSLEARKPHGLLTEFATAERAAPGKRADDKTPVDLTSKV